MMTRDMTMEITEVMNTGGGRVTDLKCAQCYRKVKGTVQVRDM